MFAIVDPGDPRKRTLTADDIAGVCAIYPEADDPRICALDLPDDGCGCAVGGGGAGAFIGALAFVLAMVAVRVSRRAR
jgi:MYXO-CTERM domain-containing protein